MSALDLIGQRFGRLVVMSRVESGRGRKLRWRCLCDCGNTTTVSVTHLRNGNTRSCGCLSREMTRARRLKHGYSGGRDRTGTYGSWSAMRARCLDPKNKEFANYGGRGIKICERWMASFTDFLADVGERPAGKTLDRYPDKNGDYAPGNVRWATPKQQKDNQRPRIIMGKPHSAETRAKMSLTRKAWWARRKDNAA